jgi:hypothetical protein
MTEKLGFEFFTLKNHISNFLNLKTPQEFHMKSFSTLPHTHTHIYIYIYI